MGAASTTVEICCFYTHEDEVWRQKLETHLSLLRRQGLVSLWHDQLIPPGTYWAHAIDIHMEAASINLLLVSTDFLASDYCYSVEMLQNARFERYRQQENIEVPNDDIRFYQIPLYLSNEEDHQLFAETRGLLLKCAKNRPVPGRRRRIVSTRFIPDGETVES